MDKVSFILTTYNSSVYLQQVLDSINNQEGIEQLISKWQEEIEIYENLRKRYNLYP